MKIGIDLPRGNFDPKANPKGTVLEKKELLGEPQNVNRRPGAYLVWPFVVK